MSTSPEAPGADVGEPASDSPLAPGRLPYIGLLRFAGADAESFLQGQVSNDTRRLRAGEPLLAAYSTAQGRVSALLRLLPHSSGIIGVLPHELVAVTLERMRKFVLRSKVALEDVTAQYAIAGVHGPQSLSAAGLPTPEPSAGYVEQGGIGIARVSAGAARCWVIGPPAALAERGLAGLDEDVRRTEHDWRLADIRAGLPQVYAATSELFVAQMLNLDLIDGISFTKGCYTGQEIIARAQHLGRIKRRMFRLQLPPGSWAIGQTLTLADGRSGRLTELSSAGRSFEALAVLGEAGATATEATSVDAVRATALPLPYSAEAAS